MGRPEIIKFAMQLIGYIKDLKHDKDFAQSRLKKIETEENGKYEQMLTKVRSLKRG